MRRLPYLLALSLVAAAPVACSELAANDDAPSTQSGESDISEAPDGVFSSTSDFSFAVDAPFNQLITRYRNNQADPPKATDEEAGAPAAPEKPKYSEPGHVVVGGKTLDVRVAIRGNTSPKDCVFPKFSVEFEDKKQTKKTPFQGSKKIRVNSHCGNGGPTDVGGQFGRIQNEISPIREELVYRLIRAAEVPTYRTRLAKIAYTDSSADAPFAAMEHFGLVIESGDVAAKRFADAGLIDAERGIYLNDDFGRPQNVGADASKMKDENIAQVYLAETMASNSDWQFQLGSPGSFWNIDVFGIPHEATQFAILQDFDLASAVNPRWTPESTVPGQMSKFRSAFASKPELAAATALHFKEKKDAVLEELAAVEKAGIDAGRLPSTDQLTTTDPGFLNAHKQLELFFALPELQ